MDTFIPADFDDDEAEPQWPGWNEGEGNPLFVPLSWEARARMLVRITRPLLAWQLANPPESMTAKWN